MRTIPPLSPDLEALLASQRAVTPVAEAVEARVIARASATPEEAGPAFVRFGGGPRWVFAAVLGGVLVLAAGAFAARTWIAAPSSEEEAPPPFMPRASSRHARRGAPLTLPRPAVEAPSDLLAPSATPPRPSRRGGVSARSGGAALVSTNAELVLLRSARVALAGGDHVTALANISEHARRFRNGLLVEEREALRVKALAGLGRHQDAQRAAAQFHARFPHSVLLSTVDRLTEARR